MSYARQFSANMITELTCDQARLDHTYGLPATGTAFTLVSGCLEQILVQVVIENTTESQTCLTPGTYWPM